MPRSVKALLSLLILVVIWLPRGLALDQFATPDEAAWVGRSAAFYHALAQRDYLQTFQHGHPGVTLTWAGTLAYRWRYPAMAWEAGQTVLKNWKNVEPFLQERGIQALDILEASRVFMVLGNTLALAVAFLYALRLFGVFPALLGFVLIALDPFFIGLARLLHLDGLVSSLMLLSLLAFMAYLYRGRRILDLVVAGVAAGLSWLTRSPSLFLGLFYGVLVLVEVLDAWRAVGKPSFKAIWASTWPILAWTAIGVIIFVALWPAMWVDPLGVLSRMFGQAFSYAAEGHASVIFFNGQIIGGDPGWLFYPLTYLWRTTPIVLLGLVLAAIGFIFNWSAFKSVEFRRSALTLALFALLFGLAMTLGAKKFDRYLLPSYGPLDLLAGMGWVGWLRWVWGRRTGWPVRGAAAGALLFALGLQLLIVLNTYPYYLSYYNPLMGGSEKAPQVMMIGWGEGLDQAARYLNTKPDAENLHVMAHYSEGSFSYFFDGTSLDLVNPWVGIESDELAGVDYLVLYIHQWQRQQPDPAMLAYFASQTPDYTVRINGLDYARIYAVHPNRQHHD